MLLRIGRGGKGSREKGPVCKGWSGKEVVLQRCDTESITLEGDDGEMERMGRGGVGRE